VIVIPEGKGAVVARETAALMLAAVFGDGVA